MRLNNESYRELLLKVKKSIIVYGVSIIISFAFISVIIGLLGFNIPRALRTLVTTSFKSSFGFEETIKKTIPLIFTTYAFAIPFMIKFFNIGGWGQMLFGGTTAAVVGLSLAGVGLPGIIMIPLLLLSGIVGGAFFGFVPGFLKARYDINPIISTIMFNFVAYLLVNFVCTTHPFTAPLEGHPMTNPLPDSGLLPPIWGSMPSSIIFALLAILVMYVLMKKTRLGYEITAVGYNLSAAQTYGINFSKTIMITFLLGGALAGLGGALEVMAIQGKLIEGFAKTSGAQYGVFGILTCLVSGGNPLGIPVAAFFMSVLLVGADSLQRTMQLPVEMVFIMQAVIVLILVVIRKKMEEGR